MSGSKTTQEIETKIQDLAAISGLTTSDIRNEINFRVRTTTAGPIGILDQMKYELKRGQIIMNDNSGQK